MAIYEVETEDGVFEVETDDVQPNLGNLSASDTQQVAGETPTKQYFKSMGKGALKGATFQDLSQEEQETPGMQLGQHAGSVIPMAISEAVVPGGRLVTPMAKAALGGMVYGAAKGAATNKPISEQPAEIAGSSLGFMGGAKIAQGLGKIFNPFSGSVSPVAKEAADLATKEGINLPLSNRTDSKLLEAGERVLEYSPFGSMITRKRDIALQGLKNLTDKIGNMIGPKRPPEVTGNLAKEATMAYKEAYDTTKNQLYDAVMPILKDKPVSMDNTIQALENVIARRSGPGEPAGVNMVRKWLEQIKPKHYERGVSRGSYIPSKNATESIPGSYSGGGQIIPAKTTISEGIPGMATPPIIESTPGRYVQYGGYTPAVAGKESVPGSWIGNKGENFEPAFGIPSMLIGEKEGPITVFNQLRKFRTNVGSRGKFNDPAASGIQSDISEIYAAVSKDLDNAASTASPEVKEGLARADEFFAQGKSTLKSKVFKALQSVNPENVHKVVIVPNSPSQVEIGKEILGDNFKDVARQWFNDGVTKATDANGVVNPMKLSNWLSKYGSTIDAVAQGNPVLQKQFDGLRKITSSFGRGRDVTSGSQTGYILGSIGQIVATVQAAFYDPVLAAKMAAGIGVQGLATKGVTSDIGTKYLTTGFPKAAEKTAAVAAPIAKTGLSNLINQYLQGR